LGLADAVIDLVETGTTMKAAGLEIVSDVLMTEAILVSNKLSKHPELVEIIKKRIQGYMTATSYMMIQYNITREYLTQALLITPGKRSPTISQLEGTDGVAVSALVLQKEASIIMDRLERVNATDILLFSINNSRM
jgi:ATP phosphoribosyltransferase